MGLTLRELIERMEHTHSNVGAEVVNCERCQFERAFFQSDNSAFGAPCEKTLLKQLRALLGKAADRPTTYPQWKLIDLLHDLVIQAEAQEGNTGTYQCPICGKPDIHKHQDIDIWTWANAQVGRFGISLVRLAEKYAHGQERK